MPPGPPITVLRCALYVVAACDRQRADTLVNRAPVRRGPGGPATIDCIARARPGRRMRAHESNERRRGIFASCRIADRPRSLPVDGSRHLCISFEINFNNLNFQIDRHIM